MKLYAPTLVLLAALVLAGAAQARTVNCNPPGNVLAWDGSRGFEIQLQDSTRPDFVGVHAHAPVFQMPLCGPSAASQAGMAAVASQRRFYVLLAAFPAKPTAAQWKARWKPLLAAAAATDADYLALVNAVIAGDPHYGGFDPVALRAHLNLDRSWLLRHEATPYGTTVA